MHDCLYSSSSEEFSDFESDSDTMAPFYTEGNDLHEFVISAKAEPRNPPPRKVFCHIAGRELPGAGRTETLKTKKLR